MIRRDGLPVGIGVVHLVVGETNDVRAVRPHDEDLSRLAFPVAALAEHDPLAVRRERRAAFVPFRMRQNGDIVAILPHHRDF